MTNDLTCLTPHSPSRSRIGRRGLISGVSAVFAASLLPRMGRARQATPPATAETMDHAASQGMAIPEIELIGNLDGLVFPEKVSAGLNKVTMINNTDTEMHVFTMRIPDDVTDDELEAAMTSDALPDWWLTTLFAGNPDQAAPGGGAASGYVHYQPGNYVIQNPFNGQMARFEATGEPWGQPAPIADVDIGLLDMAFDGFEASLPVGLQGWRVTNHGTT